MRRDVRKIEAMEWIKIALVIFAVGICVYDRMNVMAQYSIHWIGNFGFTNPEEPALWIRFYFPKCVLPMALSLIISFQIIYRKRCGWPTYISIWVWVIYFDFWSFVWKNVGPTCIFADDRISYLGILYIAWEVMFLTFMFGSSGSSFRKVEFGTLAYLVFVQVVAVYFYLKGDGNDTAWGFSYFQWYEFVAFDFLAIAVILTPQKRISLSDAYYYIRYGERLSDMDEEDFIDDEDDFLYEAKEEVPDSTENEENNSAADDNGDGKPDSTKDGEGQKRERMQVIWYRIRK